MQDIQYKPLAVNYRTYDEQANETLLLTFLPIRICSGGEILPQLQVPGAEPGWLQDTEAGVLRVFHTANNVEISGK